MATERPADRDIIRAFGILGLAWLDRLPTVGDAIAAAVHDDLELCGDGCFRPRDQEVRAAYPEGLSLTEALGWTLASAWASKAHSPVLADPGRPGSRWVAMFDSSRGATQDLMGAEEVEVVLAAWLTIRLAMRPPVAWGPRDPVADELRRHVTDARAAQGLHLAATAGARYVGPCDCHLRGLGRCDVGSTGPASDLPDPRCRKCDGTGEVYEAGQSARRAG